MKNKIIEEIYKDDFYKGYIKSLSPNLYEEAYSEFLLMVCEMCETKLKLLYESNSFRYYSVTVIRNMLFNKYSSFNKLHGHKVYEVFENTEDYNPALSEEDEPKDCDLLDELTEDIYNFLEGRTDKLDNAWYDEKLFKMYFGKDETFRSLSDKTGIPYTSIFHNIKGTQQMIQTKFKERYDNL